MGAIVKRLQATRAAAVIRQGGQTFAFIQIASDDQGARFEVRPVHVIGQSGEGVLVEGIAPGERVVLRGVSGLKAMMASAGGE